MSQMPKKSRKQIFPKTETPFRGKIPEDVISNAVKEVIKDGKKIKPTSAKYNIGRMTLTRYVRKYKIEEEVRERNRKMGIIFDEEQEAIISKYLEKCAVIFFGLSPGEVRKLAYECAEKFDLKNVPQSWHNNEMTGPHWVAGFLKRQTTFTVRSMETIYSTRPSNFHRYYINEFFSELADVLDELNIPPGRIYNLDEMGFQTIPKAPRVPSRRMRKASEDPELFKSCSFVTVEIAVNALGYTLPPMYVYPKLEDKEKFIRNRGPGCFGIENSSGKMSSREFSIYLDFFIKRTKPTPTDPVLLLLDNHPVHISIDVVEKAKANYVVLLSFPLDCAQRLQPLSVGVNRHFKTFCYKARDHWVKQNPGKEISVYEIPEIVKYALPLAATPTKIINSFINCGIWPFNPNVVTDQEIEDYSYNRYLPATVEAQEPVVYLNSYDMNKKMVDLDELIEQVCREDVVEDTGDKSKAPLVEFETIKTEPEISDTQYSERDDGCENIYAEDTLGYFEIVDCDSIAGSNPDF